MPLLSLYSKKLSCRGAIQDCGRDQGKLKGKRRTWWMDGIQEIIGSCDVKQNTNLSKDKAKWKQSTKCKVHQRTQVFMAVVSAMVMCVKCTNTHTIYIGNTQKHKVVNRAFEVALIYYLWWHKDAEHS